MQNRADRRKNMPKKTTRLSMMSIKLGKIVSILDELEARVKILEANVTIKLACPHCKKRYVNLEKHLKTCKVLKADLEKIKDGKVQNKES